MQLQVPSVVGKPLEERQAKMLKRFGFACGCRSCETDKAPLRVGFGRVARLCSSRGPKRWGVSKAWMGLVCLAAISLSGEMASSEDRTHGRRSA